MKVFVIEDDPFLNKAISVKLKKEGFETDLALDGLEAIEKLKTTPKPDLVFLDLMLPRKSGFEILEEIKKADSPLKDVPVVIMSNLGQEDDIKRGLSLGATDYLVKANIKIDEVVKKAKEILKM